MHDRTWFIKIQIKHLNFFLKYLTHMFYNWSFWQYQSILLPELNRLSHARPSKTRSGYLSSAVYWCISFGPFHGFPRTWDCGNDIPCALRDMKGRMHVHMTHMSGHVCPIGLTCGLTRSGDREIFLVSLSVWSRNGLNNRMYDTASGICCADFLTAHIC